MWGSGVQRVFLTVCLCCTLVPSPGHAYIYTHTGNGTSAVFDDLPSLFGGRLPKDGLVGILVASRPLNACVPIEPAPPLPPLTDANLTKYIVLIQRNECNFDIKVLHAQRAGFSAAIVHNMNSDILINMQSSNDTIAEEIQIPSVFTSYLASKALYRDIIPDSEAYVILLPEFSFPLMYYLIPFVAVVGMVLLIMVAVLIGRCVQQRKRMRKNRLTREQLKKIPVHKFKKGDEYDVCAICLDEYEEGDKLRVLPCSHAYHCKCVDPWLTQSRKTCPVCKQRVTRPNPDHPQSESEEEEEEDNGRAVAGEEGEGGLGAEEDTERTPLLRSSDPGSPGAYSSTMPVTQCLGSTPPRDSQLLTHESADSPVEDLDSDEDEHEDTAHLISRDLCV